MYIPAIYTLIQSHMASSYDLASHLEQLETERMGLPARREVNRRVAQLLLNLMDAGPE